MCGDKPWIQADRQTVSMLHLSLDTEGRRIICSRNPHLKMDTLTTEELWKIMEDTFGHAASLLTGKCFSPPSNQRENP